MKMLPHADCLQRLRMPVLSGKDMKILGLFIWRLHGLIFNFATTM